LPAGLNVYFACWPEGKICIEADKKITAASVTAVTHCGKKGI
jgi:hypothetical protein